MHGSFARWIRLGVAISVFASLVGTAVPEARASESEDTAAATETDDEADEENTSHGLDVGVGARIGGLGFRHVRNERLSWADCRMDGSGLFATFDFHRNFFAELSVDYYHAVGRAVSHGMDRLSLYVLGAVGARLLPDFIVSPYFQAGIGPEWTRMEVGGQTRTLLLAAPFMGIGGEINLGSLKLGSHIRSYAMGVPDHVGAHGPGKAGSGHGIPVHFENAAQVQFFARWVF